MLFDFQISKVKFSVLVLGAALAFTGCSEDEEAAVITPATESETAFSEGIDFSSIGGERAITFTTNKDWSVNLTSSDGNSDASWCSVSPRQGVAGENTVRIQADESTAYEKRSVILSLMAGDLMKEIVVSQAQKDAVLIPVSEYEVGAEGGNIQVEVQANVGYWETISGEEVNWIHAMGTRALESKFYSYTIDPYEGYDAREGEIHFSARTDTGEDIRQTVRVIQSGKAILNIAQTEYTIPDEGGQVEIEVESNFDCKIIEPQVDWLTLGQTDRASVSKYHFTVAPNLAVESREAEITFYDERETVKETVRVVQEGLSLIINEMSCEMPVGGEMQLTYSINPAIEQAGLVWSSSDENIVTITQDGLATAVGRGKAIITLSAANGITATCEITTYELTDKIGLSFNRGGLVIINGLVSGVLNSTITNNSNETIHLRTVRAYDGSTGFLVGKNENVDRILEPGEEATLGMDCNNVYLPIFVWTFTVDEVEYTVEHQFSVW